MRNRYNLVGLYSGWACRNLSKIWTGVKCVRPFLSSCFSISFLSISSSCCPSSSLFVFTLRRGHSSSSPFVVALRRRPSSSSPFYFFLVHFEFLLPFIVSLRLNSSSSPFIVALRRLSSSSPFVVSLLHRPFVVSLLRRPSRRPSSSLFVITLLRRPSRVYNPALRPSSCGKLDII